MLRKQYIIASTFSKFINPEIWNTFAPKGMHFRKILTKLSSLLKAVQLLWIILLFYEHERQSLNETKL